MEAKCPEFAAYWTTQLGANPRSLEQLRGGINNRVFRCGHGKQHWVIKGYAPTQPGKQDRMQAEVDFLQFAAQAAPGFTPVVIHVDPKRRCIVLEHLDGQAFNEGIHPSKTEIAEAVEFFRRLNSQPQLARKMIQQDAAEGFLSLTEHLINVRERLDCMGCDHLDGTLRQQAETLLRQLNRNAYRIEDYIKEMIAQGRVADTIDPDIRCVAPGDFGFHNAIRTTKRTKFIDFEFAGWDDPAKAVLDFNYQPRIPVTGEPPTLLASLSHRQRRAVISRCHTLGQVLKIKWVCIKLSVLRPERLAQITLATSITDEMSFVSKRLESAARDLNCL